MRPLLAPAAILLSLLVEHEAAATPSPPPALERVVVDWTLNHGPRGDAFVLRRGIELFVRKADLEQAGVRPEFLSPAETTLESEQWVRLNDLRPQAQYRFDEVAVALRLTVPTDALKTRVLDLKGQHAGSAPAPVDTTSGFLNYNLGLYGGRPAASTELGLAMGRSLALTTIRANPAIGVVRGLSALTVDLPERLERYQAGDAFVWTGPLGGGGVVGGLHYSRQFDLNPYLVRFPAVAAETIATTPSTVEVYVNDRLVRTERVGPGPVRLDHVPAEAGLGQTRVEITDAFGRRETISNQYYLPKGMLAEGMSDFAFALGLRRDNVGTTSFDYGEPVFLGRYRRGLGQTVTAGARAEAGLRLLSGGAQLSLGLPFGELAGEVGASAEQLFDGVTLRTGVAGGLSYAFFSRHFGVSAQVRAMSAGYANTSIAGSVQRPVLDANAGWNAGLGGASSFGFQWFLRRELQGLSHHGLSASTTTRLGSRLSVVARASATLEPVSTYELSLDLHVVLGTRLGASVWSRGNTDALTLGADVGRSLPVGTGAGFRVRGESGDTPWINGAAEYQGQHGRYSARIDAREAASSFTVETSGSLVAVGGSVFASRPVDRGFALVRVPGVSGVRAYLNNQEVGRTNADGELLVPRLIPYYANRLSIAESDLPQQYGVGAVEQTVASRERGAALAVFEARRLQGARGYVFAVNGPKVAPAKYGELTIRSGTRSWVSPLGSDGRFEFADLPPGSYAAEAAGAFPSCRFQLDIPVDERGLAEVGVVRCETK